MGLGVEGHGWELGQKMECWHWPQCCTKDHCQASILWQPSSRLLSPGVVLPGLIQATHMEIMQVD